MRIRTMQWVVEWDGKRLHVMPLLGVEGRNLAWLRERRPGAPPVVLGVFQTEKDAKTERRLIEQEEDVGRWRQRAESGEQGADQVDGIDRIDKGAV